MGGRCPAAHHRAYQGKPCQQHGISSRLRNWRDTDRTGRICRQRHVIELKSVRRARGKHSINRGLGIDFHIECPGYTLMAIGKNHTIVTGEIKKESSAIIKGQRVVIVNRAPKQAKILMRFRQL